MDQVVSLTAKRFLVQIPLTARPGLGTSPTCQALGEPRKLLYKVTMIQTSVERGFLFVICESWFWSSKMGHKI